jgi:predicted ATP-grasp superfamily ATP-dependent carboligase
MPPHDPGWHWSKAVLFAQRTLPVTPPLVESLRSIAAAWTGADDGWAALADIPAPGQEIAAGAPACTLFARGRRPEEALQFLHERVTAVDRLLAASPRVT